MTVNWLAHPAQGPLQGSVRVPSDKSISHRAVMLGGIANGTTVVNNPLLGEDVLSSIKALQAMGATYEVQPDKLVVTGCPQLTSPTSVIDCGNAGTLIRLLAGLICGRNIECTLDGDESLRKRPMKRITEPLSKMGAKIDTDDGRPPLQIHKVDALQKIEYTLPVASAQIKSAILLAGLTSQNGATVIEPAPCRDHTELILPSFGAQIKRNQDVIDVAQCKQLTATEISVPADISSAAFYIVAATIVPDSNLVLEEVCINPTRTGIINILQKMGADISIVNPRKLGNEQIADIHVKYAKLHGIEIPADQIPLGIDEFPVIFVAAALADGQTTLSDAAELRAKETDRIAAMATVLKTLGANATETPDGMQIQGNNNNGFTQGEVDSYSDHRIAMASAVAALRASDNVTITNTTNVATSFPKFTDLANQVGWQITTN